MSIDKLPISVLIASKNEIRNIGVCLSHLVSWVDEVVLVDSGSTDGTAEVARDLGCTVLDFVYAGGWPKKRQWALETYPFRNDWILIVDADEEVTEAARKQIVAAVRRRDFDGYWLKFRTAFMGRDMSFGNSTFYKLVLFRKGMARYEERLKGQDVSMADMEIHEHVVLNGTVGWLHAPIWDRNKNSLSRFLMKQDEYSNWESKAFLDGQLEDIPPKFWGNQDQRRRWMKRKFLTLPGTSLIYFIYGYIFCLGFLDGREGYIYARIQANELFNVKSKIYERQKVANISRSGGGEK